MKPSISIVIYGGILLFSAASCHNNKSESIQISTKPAVPEISDTSTTKNYFPIAGFVGDEVRYLDSTPLAIKKYITRGKHTDSSFIKEPEFRRLAQAFMPPDLADSLFEKNYTERSFMDATTGYLTFTYSPHDDNLPYRRIDALLKPAPSPDQDDKIHSLYLEKSYASGDTLYLQKLFWYARQHFLILSNVQPHGQEPITTELKVVWGDGTSQ